RIGDAALAVVRPADAGAGLAGPVGPAIRVGAAGGAVARAPRRVVGAGAAAGTRSQVPARVAAGRSRAGAAHAPVRQLVAAEEEGVVERQVDGVSLARRAVGRTRRGCRDREDAAGAAGGLHVGAVREGPGRSEQAGSGRAMAARARAARAGNVAAA